VAKSDNQPALALADVAPWFAALRGRDGMAARALEIIALTACRSGEVRGATWDELDLDRGLWTIPAARMKAGREHRVPLPPEAHAILRAVPRVSEFVFAAVRGGALSDMALSQVARRMHADKAEADVKAGVSADKAGWRDPTNGRPVVPHGLRSTFRVWAAETGADRDMAELALAHRVGTEVERAYQRSDMLERRRGLMAEWARFICA
jgi:integrase